MSDPVAVVVDDYALAALPGLERDLALAGAMVMRSFRGTPNPHLLRRWRGAAVVGGPDRAGLLARLETATASAAAPVIAVLPEGVPPAAELRGPGVVDLLPAGAPRAAERVLLMSRVPVVTGRAGRPPAAATPDRPRAASPSPGGAPAAPLAAPLAVPGGGVAAVPGGGVAAEVLAVASSTGGVWVLAATLRALPRDRAVLVAQHLETDFVAFFAEWLQGVTGWPVAVVDVAVACRAGIAYVPAGGSDLVAEGEVVRAAPPSSRYVPSGDRLLRSAAEAWGARAVGLVLSGMGQDGAAGLAELARRGGRAVCQDPATAVVPSMPEAALRLAASAALAAPDDLARVLGRARA